MNATAIQLDDINARMEVTLRFSITVGLYNGSLSQKDIAQHVTEVLNLSSVEDAITKVKLCSLETDEGKPLLPLMDEKATARRSGQDHGYNKALHEVLEDAESFIAGFEGDETQEGIDDLLERMRAALAHRETQPAN